MKTIQKISILVAALFLVIGANAQNSPKFGHISADELIQSMPETDSAMVQLQKLQQEFETTYQQLQKKYTESVADWQENFNTMSELVRSTKQQDITDLQNRMSQFEVNANQTLQQTQAELLTPIQERAINAIQEVGDEHGFTYIFDSSPNTTSILYMADDTQDIMPLVKEKLGIE